MNLTKKITLALGLVAASASFAQTTEITSQGLLGQRFADLNFGLVDTEGVSKHSYGTGISANIPFIPSFLDVGAGYSYARLRGPFKGHANSLSTYAVGYLTTGKVKPFLGATLGYTWSSLPLGFSDQGADWQLAAGVEIPVGIVTLTPSVSHADDFENGFGTDGAWSYRTEANVWLNRRNAVYAAVAKLDPKGSSIDVWSYEAGLRFRF